MPMYLVHITANPNVKDISSQQSVLRTNLRPLNLPGRPNVFHANALAMVSVFVVIHRDVSNALVTTLLKTAQKLTSRVLAEIVVAQIRQISEAAPNSWLKSSREHQLRPKTTLNRQPKIPSNRKPNSLTQLFHHHYYPPS